MTDKINTGGPAFPNIARDMSEGQPWRWTDGMTLRDYFAGQAVGEVIAYFGNMQIKGEGAPEAFARKAYEIADAMIAVRESKP